MACGNLDRLILVKCDHRNWHPGDNPLDMHHPCCPFLQPDDVAVVPSADLQLSLSFGDSLQQCPQHYRLTVVPQVPQTTLSSSSSSPKEGKAGCSPFKHNGASNGGRLYSYAELITANYLANETSNTLICMFKIILLLAFGRAV